VDDSVDDWSEDRALRTFRLASRVELGEPLTLMNVIAVPLLGRCYRRTFSRQDQLVSTRFESFLSSRRRGPHRAEVLTRPETTFFRHSPLHARLADRVLELGAKARVWRQAPMLTSYLP
jgi:hypothetical protein